MSEYTIYHNPRCSKSRQTLALLEEHGINPKVVKYLDDTPSSSELNKLIKLLGISARELLRKTEADYKALNLSDKDLTDSALIEAMCSHPKLIERPIVIKDSKTAVLGRPPENVLTLI